MGNAIASSISPAIAQQVALNAAEISDAIAPTMGQAVKKQIVLEQDAMIDALYPIIGNTQYHQSKVSVQGRVSQITRSNRKNSRRDRCLWSLAYITHTVQSKKAL